MAAPIFYQLLICLYTCPGIYPIRIFGQQLDRDRGRFKTATVFSSLLTFQGMVHTLDDDWVLPGLGHTYSLAPETVRNAAVLHFNGNRKPWLELGIQKYKTFWRTYLNREHRFLSDCNVNP